MSEIRKISELFERYKTRLVAPQKTVETAAREVIQSTIGIVLTPSQITYTPHTRAIAINASGMIRSEIKAREGIILIAIEKIVGSRNNPEVIL